MVRLSGKRRHLGRNVEQADAEAGIGCLRCYRIVGRGVRREARREGKNGAGAGEDVDAEDEDGDNSDKRDRTEAPAWTGGGRWRGREAWSMECSGLKDAERVRVGGYGERGGWQ